MGEARKGFFVLTPTSGSPSHVREARWGFYVSTPWMSSGGDLCSRFPTKRTVRDITFHFPLFVNLTFWCCRTGFLCLWRIYLTTLWIFLQKLFVFVLDCRFDRESIFLYRTILTKEIYFSRNKIYMVRQVFSLNLCILLLCSFHWMLFFIYLYKLKCSKGLFWTRI